METMKILILDNELNQIALLTNCISVVFNRVYNNLGGFEIQVNLNQLNASELQPGRIIYIDTEDTGILTGIIETVDINHTTNLMGEVVVASGCELKDVIKRRVVLIPEGEDKYTFTDKTTESIIYELSA